MSMSIETILIVDTETQGFDPQKHRVLEIGAVWWSVRFRTILAAWSELCQAPDNPAEHVNRIPAAALTYGLTFEQAIEGLKSRASRADAIVAHRASFDSSFVPDLGKPWICSKFDVPWPRSAPGDGLAYVAIAHDVPIVSAHRALADCLLLARCFEAVDDVPGLLALAMRPRATFRAIVSYDDRELAKKAGFRWQPEKKWWIRERLAIEDAALLPFKTERV